MWMPCEESQRHNYINAGHKIMQESSSSSAAASGIASKKQADLQAQYNSYKSTLQQLAQKIGELESEGDEHKLVLETLQPLPGSRKCFRMIGGVLVERTVAEVIPALETNAKGVENVLQQLVKEYKKTEEDMKKWQTKNKVQVVQGP
ncbi:Prefoldin subunit-domain-containing protein [Lipomyces starkeyi]